MPSQFNSYLDNINTDYWRDLCMNHGELRHYEKGDEFITAGTVGRYIGYILNGSFKYVCYSAEDNRPNVIGLEFAGHFVCDFPFSLYGQRSRSSIIATTPSDLYCLPSTYVAGLLNTDATLRENIAASTTAVFATLYDRYVDLYTKTPLQRYHELLHNDPDLFNSFSLQDIASFLKISPTHLSRLRNKK